MNSFGIRQPEFFNLRLSLLSKDCQRRTNGFCSSQRSPKVPKVGGGAYIPATIHVEAEVHASTKRLCSTESALLSGVREWRADNNRYRKLEHTMIHDVQIQN